MKFKKERIALTTSKGCKNPELREFFGILPCELCERKDVCQETVDIQAEVKGNYAVHPSFKRQYKYTVTHVPTGFYYYDVFNSIKESRAFIDALIDRGYTGDDIIHEYSRGLKADAEYILGEVNSCQDMFY